MIKKKFKAEVISGHKGDAVEVPFDPAKEWNITPKPLWHGRRGHAVTATVNGLSFESVIVPRQKKFYLLIDDESRKAARVSNGMVIQVALAPGE
jgi:hypothetical protein